MNEKIPGGLAKGMSLADIAKHHKMPVKSLKTKLEQGIKTEMEHTTDKDVAREIAMDHIYEDPNYYSKLKKIETEGTCGYNQDVETGEIFDTPGGLREGDKKGIDAYSLELQKGLEEAILDGLLNEKDPKTGTGKKPKGSSRRLYTDEDPSDTVGVKFSTKQDIIDTLSKTSFKSKSHARQSQIINLIHQRVRAAYERAKDPDVKRRLKTALDYAEQRKEASKDKTQRLKQLKEIGDASAQMFDYNKNQIKTAVNKIMQDVEREKSNEEFSFQEYPLTTFKSPNAEYDVFIGNTIFPWFYSIPENFRNLGDSKIIRDKLLRRIQIQIGFNINNNDKQTNFNEQFKVLSTVTNIAKELIKEIDKFNNILPAITIYAKVNEEDEILDPENPFDNSSTTSQRGKFYEKYIEKLLPNLPGNWVLKKNPMYFYLYNADKEKKYIEKFEKEFTNNLNEAKGSAIPYGSGYKQVNELRQGFFNYLKQQLPNMPEYVIQDWVYKMIKNDGGQPWTKEGIQNWIDDQLKDIKWEYKTNFPISMDIFGDKTKKELESRIGGEIRQDVGKDIERHKTQQNLLKSQGISKEPIIIFKTKNGKYELGEGWHRTTQAFKMYPEGFIQPKVYIGLNAKWLNEIVKEITAFSNPPHYRAVEGSAIPYGSGYKKYIPEITKFMLDKGMNIKPLPVVKFIEDDEENAKNILGRTAFYNPNEKSISLFTLGRHPKDILRSFCHEMIHHMQNIEDRLPAFSTTNTQEDSTLNDIEEEAHKLGSMLMREFEDTIKK